MAADGFPLRGNATEVFLRAAGVVVTEERIKPHPDHGPLVAVLVVLDQEDTPVGSFAVVTSITEAARLIASVEENARQQGVELQLQTALDQMRMWVRGARDV